MKKILLCMFVFGQIVAMDQQTPQHPQEKTISFHLHIPTLHTFATKTATPTALENFPIGNFKEEVQSLNKSELENAFKKDNPDLLAYFIQKEKNIVRLDRFKGLVTQAINSNSQKIVEFLFAHAKNIPQDVLNYFLASSESEYNTNTMWRFLIEKTTIQAANLGIDRGSFFSKWNNLPLHMAVITNNEKDVEAFIVKHKGNNNIINQADSIGETPLILALKYGTSDDIAEKLINAGADIKAKNRKGETALHFASLNGNTNIAEQLINKGANVNAKTEDLFGWTPLIWACINNKPNIVYLLITNNADVNTTAVENYTPLHIASKIGEKALAELLIEKKANINAIDVVGKTPLHHASQNGHIDIVKLLINKKADVNAKDNFDHTPLHYAREEELVTFIPALRKKYTDIINLLKLYGAE